MRGKSRGSGVQHHASGYSLQPEASGPVYSSRALGVWGVGAAQEGHGGWTWGPGEAQVTHAPYFALPCPSQTYSAPTVPKKTGCLEDWVPETPRRGRGKRREGEVTGRETLPAPRSATIRRAGGGGSRSTESSGRPRALPVTAAGPTTNSPAAPHAG